MLPCSALEQCFLFPTFHCSSGTIDTREPWFLGAGPMVTGSRWLTHHVGCMVTAPNRLHGHWVFRFPRRHGDLTRLASRRAIQLGRQELWSPTDQAGKAHWSLGARVKWVARRQAPLGTWVSCALGYLGNWMAGRPSQRWRIGFHRSWRAQRHGSWKPWWMGPLRACGLGAWMP
jgi:hypothetical protein